MFKAVLISRFGNLKTIEYKDLKDLKSKFSIKGKGKCSILHKYKDQDNITYLGYKTGEEKIINKHELPEPIDVTLFYGDIIVYKPKKNFSDKEYKKFYNEYFQFEDLDDTIIQDELFEQDDDYDFSDGFLVRDSECDEEFIEED